MSGTLHMTIEEAKLKRDTETFGTMDPYVKIKFNEETHKSETVEDGGKHPKWNYKLKLEVNDLMDDIKFEVWDSNTFSDDVIAKTVGLKVFSIIGPNKGMTEDHPLFYEDENRGTIKIRTRWVPEGEEDCGDVTN